MTKIEMQVGDKVIRADGLAGNVVEIYEGETIPYEHEATPCAVVKCENGKRLVINEEDYVLGYKSYYLIGTTVLGNKRPLEELDDRIADTHQEIERLKAEEKQLRKQRWRLETQMNGNFVPQNPKKEENDD